MADTAEMLELSDQEYKTPDNMLRAVMEPACKKKWAT